ncbi:SGNH/GDSL hydrolase family protein (plasmid) [Streptomyces clavuligerus]|nr:SGNH/GDSL hydrolase family protein [Streptomyces clavuligerus]QCS10924.1 SGNH/GDSL hydrolase family protein [Streptomyces clavuligerus]QPJ98484.1 SGNH/GDSL hydrolase family protein [Streptomyces clavuligerus]
MAAFSLANTPARATTEESAEAPPIAAARLSALASANDWSGAWAAAHQYPVAAPVHPYNWSVEGFGEQSVRQVVRLSAGGRQLRVRLSNRYGKAPLRIADATVARSGRGAALGPGGLRTLRFGDAREVTIAPGAERVSDSFRLPVRPLTRLTVTLYLTGSAGPVSFHAEGLTTAYRADGNRTRDVTGRPFQGPTTLATYALSDVEVSGPVPGATNATNAENTEDAEDAENGRSAGRSDSRRNAAEGTVVAFGDSITDGSGSTPDTDRRYPDRLAELLTAAGSRLAVVNTGISGNRLLSDNLCYGERALTRFRHDVLARPGVRTAVVLIGINDIGAARSPDTGCGVTPESTARQLIDGHKALIRAARAQGVTVVGATLLPFRNALYGYWSPAKNALRKEVNHWLRTSGAYDRVVDLDRVLRDPADPDRLLAAYDAGDHLHPNDAGMDAIARAVFPYLSHG